MTDLSLIEAGRWQLAEDRARVLRPLLADDRCSGHQVRAAAADLNLSERQTRTLLARLRAGDGAVTALVSQGSDGGRGRSRLNATAEAALATIIAERYATQQRLSPAMLIHEVSGRCRQHGIATPSANTVRRRVAALSISDRSRRGEALLDPTAVHGPARVAEFPLDLIQVDHTKVDIILVDPVDRQPIGRPYITIAIDVATRMIAGFHLSLEAPGSTSVGLCLLHVTMDKAPWLSELGIEANWPLAGKPRAIGVDNAAEFHGQAFERGCQQHDITIDFRPPGMPHFGGIVERVIGTLMKLVHALPGTTFSSVAERGKYPSDKLACLTLAELERWLTVAITKYYHLSPHNGLDSDTPLARCEARLAQLKGQSILQPRDPHAYLIDFLPVIRRTLQRDGIKVDHVTYFAQALVPWIAERERGHLLVIRRDPRDLSRIFVLDERDGNYIEVASRDLSRPAVSLWEHRVARRRLREKHGQVTETALFDAIEEMRAIERTAASLTQTARRDRARRASSVGEITKTKAPLSETAAPAERENTPSLDGIRPFDVIEAW